MASAWFLLDSAHAEAHAQHFVAITYDVDPTLEACPNVTEFRATLAQQLGYDPYRVDSPNGVRVSVQRTESGIEGAVEWSTLADEPVEARRFAARIEDCPKMVATVGFVVAVQIQLMAAGAAPVTDVNAQASTMAAGSPRGGDASKLEVESVAEPTLSLRSFEVRRMAPFDGAKRGFLAGLGPSMGFGIAPDPVVFGRLFGAAQFEWFGLEAGVERSLPSTTTQTYGGGFEHTMTLGTLATCGWHRSMAACALTKLGRIHVNGFGVDRAASPTGFVAQVGPRMAYAFALGHRVHLIGRVEVLYSLTAWTVELNHVAVWNTPRLSAVAGIDLATGFQ